MREYISVINNEGADLKEDIDSVNLVLHDINAEKTAIPGETYFFNITTRYLTLPINESIQMDKSA